MTAVTGLATLLVLADGRLPAGGHAHSGGLEAAVTSGRLRDLAGLTAFLHGRLAGTGRVAAAFAAAACAAGSADNTAGSADNTAGKPADSAARFPGEPPGKAGDATPGDGPDGAAGSSFEAPGAAGDATPGDGPDGAAGSRLDALDRGMDARTPSPALRRASRAQGRALLRAGRAMWPVDPVIRNPHHPVALGVVAAAAGLSPAEAAVAGAYGTVSGPASAAVRLLGLDPYTVHALLAELAGVCDRLAALAVTGADDPVDQLPADSTPLLEIGAEVHASWEVRLFAS
ncbi:urease accessory protein UreF [Plantactinospora sp. KLBMP9567]|uniref:urease accessory protein UreF n=1 Tax=Plantactinospora sp. KLBMP9567 TaxID=3085900 RepID=UPI002980E27E|nr:urease accessory UreF family protein [Plantactinospora sp. KLBMP9567]MDW5326087.1 urease accessory UreF family protein [Plantactinospora sp. KLBMP9567]